MGIRVILIISIMNELVTDAIGTVNELINLQVAGNEHQRYSWFSADVFDANDFLALANAITDHFGTEILAYEPNFGNFGYAIFQIDDFYFFLDYDRNFNQSYNFNLHISTSMDEIDYIIDPPPQDPVEDDLPPQGPAEDDLNFPPSFLI